MEDLNEHSFWETEAGKLVLSVLCTHLSPVLTATGQSHTELLNEHGLDGHGPFCTAPTPQGQGPTPTPCPTLAVWSHTTTWGSECTRAARAQLLLATGGGKTSECPQDTLGPKK